MARTVDPRRHAERRLLIVDAALTCFARLGYHGATTAEICREAGIGSGTFFHYFPTKADVLLAILDLGTRETRAWFAAQEGRDDAAGVLRDVAAWQVDELADPRIAGFVRAVASVMNEPEVARALADDAAALADGLTVWVARAQRVGDVRADQPARTLATWMLLVLDGFIGRIADQPGFTALGEAPMLADALERLLRP